MSSETESVLQGKKKENKNTRKKKQKHFPTVSYFTKWSFSLLVRLADRVEAHSAGPQPQKNFTRRRRRAGNNAVLKGKGFETL